MGKNALYYLTPHIMAEPLPFKRLALLFDKIYIRDRILSPDTEKYNKPELFELHGEFWQKVFTNSNEIEYLKELDIIATYDPDYTYGVTEPEREELRKLLDQASPELKKATQEGFPDASSRSGIDGVFAESANMSARIEALMLQSSYDIECVPVMFTPFVAREQDKKQTVFQFLLNEIPEPDESVSWKQIADFRSDEETRLKYLALVNWVNEIARSPYSISEIKDKYDYLYLAYKKGFERHKMKSGFSTLEIIATASTSLLTGNLPLALSAVSTFLKVGVSSMNLLKEEGALPGKEIAYIYHADKKFAHE